MSEPTNLHADPLVVALAPQTLLDLQAYCAEKDLSPSGLVERLLQDEFYR